jgi:hypothetical protein
VVRAGDWQWCIREALRSYDAPVLLVTITAPGRDVLPYDESGARCSRAELSDWCSTLQARWHGLRDRSRKRALGSGSGLVVLSYVWQLQERGAPHMHVVVPAGPVGRRFAAAVKDSAADFGFGFVDIKSGGGFAPAVANYISRYLARDIESRGVYESFGEYLPSRPAYVATRLLRRAGVGIRVARRLRHLWVFANRDESVGLPRFKDDREEAWVYYWYRVGRRGRENVRRPVGAASWS